MSFQETIKANVLAIRAAAADFLTDTCYIRRKTTQTVDDGENIVTYATGVETACRLIIRSGSESTNIAAQQRLVSAATFTGLFRIQLPYGTEIQSDDHIEYIDTVTGDVRTFEVVFAPPFNEMTGAYVISVQEVR